MGIFLSVGHGTSTNGVWDPGCVCMGDTEAGLMLPIGQVTARILRQHGVEVHTDADTGNDRNIVRCVEDANNIGVDAYISLHCDYDKAPSGTLPIINPGSDEGFRLAQCINASVMLRMDIGTRGILQRGDMEVRLTDAPACIFETGSIRADIGKLTKAEAYGKAVAYGIMDYLGVSYMGVTPEPPAPGEPITPEPPEPPILLECGDTGEVVEQLQRDLYTLAYEDGEGNPLDIDGDFGGCTEAAVIRLQQCHGLEADGVVGPLTDAALMREVQGVQRALVANGYPVVVDGAVGVQTLAAIKDFQRKNGLEADGVVGRLTAKVLGL